MLSNRLSKQVPDTLLCCVQMKIHADYTSERIGKPDLEITLVDDTTGQEFRADLSDVTSSDWQLPAHGFDEKSGTGLCALYFVSPCLHSSGCLLCLKRTQSLLPRRWSCWQQNGPASVLHNHAGCCRCRCQTNSQRPCASRLESARYIRL